MEKTCKNCKCWEPKNNSSDGVCKARAPQTTIMKPTTDGLTLVRPSTVANDWCIHDFVAATID